MSRCQTEGGRVTSEVHQDCWYLHSLSADVFSDEGDHPDDVGSDTVCVTTTLTLTFPAEEAQKLLNMPSSIQIEHARTTEVDLVGLQIWRGALLMADFILAHPEWFRNSRVLELASGTGVTSVIAALTAKSVVVTDVNRGHILEQIQRNFHLNRHELNPDCLVRVAELDFFKTDWHQRLKEEVSDCDTILAADVVYDGLITERFFDTISFIMAENKKVKIFISVERRSRVNEDGQETAPNFDHFLHLLNGLASRGGVGEAWTVQELSLGFHKVIVDYERVASLHLWKVENRAC